MKTLTLPWIEIAPVRSVVMVTAMPGRTVNEPIGVLPVASAHPARTVEAPCRFVVVAVLSQDFFERFQQTLEKSWRRDVREKFPSGPLNGRAMTRPMRNRSACCRVTVQIS